MAEVTSSACQWLVIRVGSLSAVLGCGSFGGLQSGLICRFLVGFSPRLRWHRPIEGLGDFLGIDFQASLGFRRALGQVGAGLETGGNDRDANLFSEGLVVTVAPDDLSGGARLVLDVVRDLGDLVHQELIGAVRDVEQDEVGAGDVVVVEER